MVTGVRLGNYLEKNALAIANCNARPDLSSFRGCPDNFSSLPLTVSPRDRLTPMQTLTEIGADHASVGESLADYSA
jgi:hypothetical protein